MKIKEKYFEKNHGELLGLIILLLGLIITVSHESALKSVLSFHFFEVNKMLHCPKFLGMETKNYMVKFGQFYSKYE